MKYVYGLEKPPLEEVIEHYGVKGMRWGVRRSQAQLDRAAGRVPRKTKRAAKKDAKEFARAKAFYGEGAGTRRKLIRESVQAKSKRDPTYKKIFDEYLSDQQMDKHVSKAKSERKSADRSKKNKQRISALARRVTSEQGTQAAFVAMILAGAAYAKSPQAQAVMKNTMRSAKNTVNNMATAQQRRKMDKELTEIFKKSFG